MAQVDSQLSTGLPGLDTMLKGLIPGDNIVWQLDNMDDLSFLLKPYCESARVRGRKIVYFRFAKHELLVSDDCGAEVYELSPDKGFEMFIADVHKVIRKAGRGAFFIFDCLSDLAMHWYSDQMLGNFFMLTCPFLFDVEAIAYFPLLRGQHSNDAVMPIQDTAQVVIDVFRHKGSLYLHPLKVQQRHSPTMYMLHKLYEGRFVPVTESATISEIMMSVPRPNLESPESRLGFSNRVFMEAREYLEPDICVQRSASEAQEYFKLTLRMIISRDERVLQLAEKYFTLADVLNIRKRMVGTGLIGGKSVGMLIARAILHKSNARWDDLLEPHDSFYIGSDIFYTFIVRNGNWYFMERQKESDKFLEGSDEARRRMLTGDFPPEIRQQFSDMLDYYGQSPVIVRSSSLLEDNYGNAFSGKYESVFCANQGSRDKRLEDFLSAVRTIYASTMSEKALSYRARRGLLDRDEQMALLVQRVSGAMHKRLFYPQVAGVGYSYNPYVWNTQIDPDSGMLRLVFGLGTRAVDRADDDYTRVVALNAPEMRPESDLDKVRKFAQRKVDVIDLDSNQLNSAYFSDITIEKPLIPIDMFASRDLEVERAAARSGNKNPDSLVLTFDKLLKETEFVNDMRDMLHTIEKAYNYNVDTEFTANFIEDGKYKINLLQCRPLQMRGYGPIYEPPAKIADVDLIVESNGPVIGQSKVVNVDWIIYVVPTVYGVLPMEQRYAAARLIGKLMHHEELKKSNTRMLIGPGRWGSAMPALGVPVSFAEINTVSILCEIVAMNDNLVPDISLGTHFFNDLVEADILYLGLFPGREFNVINETFLMQSPNVLTELVPNTELSHIVRVINTSMIPYERVLKLNSNAINQRVLCYLEDKIASPPQ
ncbi:MAG: PEP/pyruvate-binding domain-containing protein [bacterium]